MTQESRLAISGAYVPICTDVFNPDDTLKDLSTLLAEVNLDHNLEVFEANPGASKAILDRILMLGQTILAVEPGPGAAARLIAAILKDRKGGCWCQL